MEAIALDNGTKFNDISFKKNPLSTLGKTPDFKKLSTVKTAVEISFNKETLKASKLFLKTLEVVVDHLPVDNFEYSKGKKFYTITNINIQVLEGFLSFLKEYDVSNSTTKKTLETLEKCLNVLAYISEYMHLAIKIYEDRKEISDSEKIYTFEELKSELAA